MTATEHGQCQTAHAIRCRDQSRVERQRLDTSKAKAEERKRRDALAHEARALARYAAREPKTHCDYGHEWIPANLIVTRRVTKAGRVYHTARCAICGRKPKPKRGNRGPVEGSRAEMRTRAQTIQHRILGTCTDLMTQSELAEWRETLAGLRSEYDRLMRASGNN